MADSRGRFHLYSGTLSSLLVVALYQIQNGQLWLIGYNSKVVPVVTQNYSITRLEWCGLTINIASLSNLLKGQWWYSSRPFSPNIYYENQGQNEKLRGLKGY